MVLSRKIGGNDMKKYEVIEDNGGGLHLVIFGTDGNVEYLQYGTSGRLINDLQALKNGDDPVTDWEGNEENPQEVYDYMTSFEYGWEVVADNEGIYPNKMGCAARIEVGVKRE